MWEVLSGGITNHNTVICTVENQTTPLKYFNVHVVINTINYNIMYAFEFIQKM